MEITLAVGEKCIKIKITRIQVRVLLSQWDLVLLFPNRRKKVIITKVIDT